jgi:hypothetical protein
MAIILPKKKVLPFMLARWRKKKVGVGQEEAGHVAGILSARY